MKPNQRQYRSGGMIEETEFNGEICLLSWSPFVAAAN